MVDDVPVSVEHRKVALISVHRQKVSDSKVFIQYPDQIEGQQDVIQHMPDGQVLRSLMGVWQPCDVQDLVLFEGLIADGLHKQAHFQSISTDRGELQPGIQRGSLVAMQEEGELSEPATVVFVYPVPEYALQTLGHAASPVDILLPYIFQPAVKPFS
jgi:hypothetical protein